MSRKLIAAILTVAVLGLILSVGTRRPPSRPGGSGTAAVTPEDRLRRCIEDARAGDLDGYLGAYAEPLRSRIAREADEAGRPAFAEVLRRASEARKGYALYSAEPDGPDAVRIAVEAVYGDRNERQVYHMERGPDGWRITAVESARGREPSARFGESATYKEPEGIPVEGSEPPDPSEDPGL